MKTAMEVVTSGFNAIVQNGVEYRIVGSDKPDMLYVRQEGSDEIVSIKVADVQKFSRIQQNNREVENMKKVEIHFGYEDDPYNYVEVVNESEVNDMIVALEDGGAIDVKAVREFDEKLAYKLYGQHKNGSWKFLDHYDDHPLIIDDLFNGSWTYTKYMVICRNSEKILYINY